MTDGSNHQPLLAPPHDRRELEAAYYDCKLLARRTARNFYYSFLVLPRQQRLAMCALYTFMRHTDDLGDSDAPTEQRRSDLQAWRAQLDAALAGEAVSERWWLALADTISRHAIPPEALHAVIDGVLSDLDVCRYESFASLYHYCYRVASAVGLASVRIWGVTDPRAELPAEWCGLAFQLTNILRDIVEDFQRGRIYLPADELVRFGVTEDVFATRRSTPEFEEMMRFQIARAHDYYERARELDAYLPRPGRAVLRVMVNVYRGLLYKIEQDPTAVLRKRISLSPPRKLAFVLGAIPMRLACW